MHKAISLSAEMAEIRNAVEGARFLADELATGGMEDRKRVSTRAQVLSAVLRGGRGFAEAYSLLSRDALDEVDGRRLRMKLSLVSCVPAWLRREDRARCLHEDSILDLLISC